MSFHYVHVFNRGQKRRLDIDPDKGLGKYLDNQRILEKRVRVKSGEEFQQLLEQGSCFSILKFDPHRFRWKSMILFHKENASVQDNDLIINGNPKPLKLAGLLDTDPHNLDVLTIFTKKPNAPHLTVIHKPSASQPSQHTPHTHEEDEESTYYVHVFSRGQKHKLHIHLRRGLGNYLVCNKILERRVLVNTPEEAQQLLEQGHRFAILKFDPLRFRWKSLILFDNSNAQIQNQQLIINDTAKPLQQSGLMQSDPSNLDVLTIFHLEQLHTPQQQLSHPHPKLAVG